MDGDNPLLVPGTGFSLDLRFPSPTFRRTKNGPVWRVSFEVTPEVWQWFADAPDSLRLECEAIVGVETGAGLPCADVAQALAEISARGNTEVAPPPEIVAPAPSQAVDSSRPPGKGPHGRDSALLFRSRWFASPALADAVGTPEEYVAWVQTQPSVVSGEWSEVLESGEGRCIAAHVRRVADGAGTGIKPPWMVVPLTDAEHRMQHEGGEIAPLRAAGIAQPDWTAADVRLWWETAATEHRARWVEARILSLLGCESWTEVDPEVLRAWLADLPGPVPTLPRGYGGA